MNRFKTVSQTETEQNRDGASQNSCNPSKSSPNRQNPRSPVRKSPMPRPRSRSPVRKSPAKPVSPDEKYYPGVNSLKKVKVSPPRQGNMYPDLTENFFNERPDTAMSEESVAPSEAPRQGNMYPDLTENFF